MSLLLAAVLMALGCICIFMSIYFSDKGWVKTSNVLGFVALLCISFGIGCYRTALA